MGGCASRPKESHGKALPSEDTTRHVQVPKAADPIAENNADVETANEEKSFLNTSEPKQDAPNSDGESKVEQDNSTTGPVPETSKSGDSEKVSEAGVKPANPTQGAEATDVEPTLTTQKSEAEGEGAVSNTESKKKQGEEKKDNQNLD